MKQQQTVRLGPGSVRALSPERLRKSYLRAISSRTVSYIRCLRRFRISCRSFERWFCSRASRCFKPDGEPPRPETPCLWLPMPPRPWCISLKLHHWRVSALMMPAATGVAQAGRKAGRERTSAAVTLSQPAAGGVAVLRGRGDQSGREALWPLSWSNDGA